MLAEGDALASALSRDEGASTRAREHAYKKLMRKMVHGWATRVMIERVAASALTEIALNLVVRKSLRLWAKTAKSIKSARASIRAAQLLQQVAPSDSESSDEEPIRSRTILRAAPASGRTAIAAESTRRWATPKAQTMPMPAAAKSGARARARASQPEQVDSSSDEGSWAASGLRAPASVAMAPMHAPPSKTGKSKLLGTAPSTTRDEAFDAFLTDIGLDRIGAELRAVGIMSEKILSFMSFADVRTKTGFLLPSERGARGKTQLENWEVRALKAVTAKQSEAPAEAEPPEHDASAATRRPRAVSISAVPGAGVVSSGAVMGEPAGAPPSSRTLLGVHVEDLVVASLRNGKASSTLISGKVTACDDSGDADATCDVTSADGQVTEVEMMLVALHLEQRGTDDAGRAGAARGAAAQPSKTAPSHPLKHLPLVATATSRVTKTALPEVVKAWTRALLPAVARHVPQANDIESTAATSEEAAENLEVLLELAVDAELISASELRSDATGEETLQEARMRAKRTAGTLRAAPAPAGAGDALPLVEQDTSDISGRELLQVAQSIALGNKPEASNQKHQGHKRLEAVAALAPALKLMNGLADKAENNTLSMDDFEAACQESTAVAELLKSSGVTCPSGASITLHGVWERVTRVQRAVIAVAARHMSKSRLLVEGGDGKALAEAALYGTIGSFDWHKLYETQQAKPILGGSPSDGGKKDKEVDPDKIVNACMPAIEWALQHLNPTDPTVAHTMLAVRSAIADCVKQGSSTRKAVHHLLEPLLRLLSEECIEFAHGKKLPVMREVWNTVCLQPAVTRYLQSSGDDEKSAEAKKELASTKAALEKAVTKVESMAKRLTELEQLCAKRWKKTAVVEWELAEREPNNTAAYSGGRGNGTKGGTKGGGKPTKAKPELDATKEPKKDGE